MLVLRLSTKSRAMSGLHNWLTGALTISILRFTVELSVTEFLSIQKKLLTMYSVYYLDPVSRVCMTLIHSPELSYFYDTLARRWYLLLIQTLLNSAVLTLPSETYVRIMNYTWRGT